MKKGILLFAVISILLLDCTSIHNVSDEPDAFVEKFNKAAKNKDGTILLVNGQTITGFDISMSGDSTYWGDKLKKTKINPWKKAQRHSMPTSEIKEIVITSHGNGALQGMGIGLLTASSIAYLIGCLSYEENSEFSRGDIGAIFAVYIGAPIGSILGFIIGHGTGSKDIFVLSQDSTMSKKD